MYLAPKSNLCRQAEKDWQSEWGPEFANPKMGRITRRVNKNPIRLPGSFGYITTYQALAADYRISNLMNHLNAVSGKRFLLVCDEAQILGVEKKDKDAVASTKAVRILADKATFVLLMTATELRSDRRRVFMGDYSDPDEDGRIKLLADVYGSYRNGLAKSYLRPIDAKLISGEADWRNLDTNEIDNIIVDEDKTGLYKVVGHPGFFGAIVDAVVARVREAKLADSRYCGLITAMTQRHARDIKKYLEKKHKSIRCLIAISEDGDEAHTNLETYKKGGYDLIIAVGMVYVGYSHPPITVIGILTNIRFFGYLDQLIGRGLRMWKERPSSEQVCFIVAPNDPAMIRYIEKLREDNRLGLLERDGDGGGEYKPLFGVTERAAATGESGKGISIEGDLDQVEMPRIESAMAEHNISGSRTGMAKLFRQEGVNISDIGTGRNGYQADDTYVPEQDKMGI